SLDALRQLDACNRIAVALPADTDPVIDLASDANAQHSRQMSDGGLSIRALTDWVNPYFERADNIAKHFQTKYEHAEMPLFVLAAAAVLVVALQVAFFRKH